ncbi:MAG: type II toxin-antitoxin system YafQ family toxin [Bacteroidales bacterium]|nr:type II toxin-antitoxin system YafQ family toxin [Bacteroidales bacterium]MCL2133649.1 type II toxin-antitoxin system YafQ family toxin [Bacteroidales bacterium]
MLKIAFTNQYLKDLELMKRRNLPKAELDEVVKLLSNEQPLLPKHKDHALKGNFTGYRECHIRPDWLLIYKIDKQILTLVLIRTGTHSDLF